MSHNRRTYNQYGGYDSTGRWRSEAWHMDGGANDEGYHHRHCYACGSVTEHDLQNCIPCGDRAIRQRRKLKEISVGEYTVKVYPTGKKYCNCQGFKFRKDCKHIRSV